MSNPTPESIAKFLRDTFFIHQNTGRQCRLSGPNGTLLTCPDFSITEDSIAPFFVEIMDKMAPLEHALDGGTSIEVGIYRGEVRAWLVHET